MKRKDVHERVANDMSLKKAKEKRAPRRTVQKTDSPPGAQRESGDPLVGKEPPSKIIDRLLGRVLSQTSEMKGSISDAIRLLQMKRELAGEQLKRIEVKWVEPSDAEPASSE